jgi:hypothetical protein
LIEDVAHEGGLILSTGLVLDDSSRENLLALIKAGKKCGVCTGKLGGCLVSALSVAVVILAVPTALLLTRPGPKITGLIVLHLVVLTASSE